MTHTNINVTKLEPNTEIMVETEHTVYEITILDPKECNMSIHGGLRFIRPTIVHLRGSVRINQEDDVKYCYIEGGKSLIFTWTDELGNHDVFTNPVLSARVTAPDKSWYYDVIAPKEEKVNEDTNKA